MSNFNDEQVREYLKAQNKLTEAEAVPNEPTPKRQFVMNEFVQSAIHEASEVRHWIDGVHVDNIDWHAPGVPHVIFAITVLAPKYKIEMTEVVSIKQHSSNAHWNALVKCCCHLTRSSRICAGTSQHQDVAVRFAWRNAISQLIPQ